MTEDFRNKTIQKEITVGARLAGKPQLDDKQCMWMARRRASQAADGLFVGGSGGCLRVALDLAPVPFPLRL